MWGRGEHAPPEKVGWPPGGPWAPHLPGPSPPPPIYKPVSEPSAPPSPSPAFLASLPGWPSLRIPACMFPPGGGKSSGPGLHVCLLAPPVLADDDVSPHGQVGRQWGGGGQAGPARRRLSGGAQGLPPGTGVSAAQAGRPETQQGQGLVLPVTACLSLTPRLSALPLVLDPVFSYLPGTPGGTQGSLCPSVRHQEGCAGRHLPATSLLHLSSSVNESPPRIHREASWLSEGHTADAKGPWGAPELHPNVTSGEAGQQRSEVIRLESQWAGLAGPGVARLPFPWSPPSGGPRACPSLTLELPAQGPLGAGRSTVSGSQGALRPRGCSPPPGYPLPCAMCKLPLLCVFQSIEGAQPPRRRCASSRICMGRVPREKSSCWGKKQKEKRRRCLTD